MNLLKSALLAAAVALFAVGSQSQAATSINYGDFGPDAPAGATGYLDVTESSGTDAVPLFGAPDITGDTLDFDPKGFVASAVDSMSDITNGQLNYTLITLPGTGAVSIMISESGDMTLIGTGTAATMVSAGVSIDIDILEVDGVVLANPISVFASNSLSRDLVSDGPVALAPWSNSLMVDFAPILAAHNIDFTLGVTRAEIVIDDSLIAISEPLSTSLIAKKDFTITTTTQVPEPASLALLGLGAACMLRRTK